MATWLVPRQDLTPDQARIVEMPPTVNRVVLGMAGAGKTQVLVHRAAHLSERYRIPPERFRIFVFTNVIKEYIRSGLEFLNLPDDVVSTFDFWCVDLYERYIDNHLPWKAGGKGVDFPEIRRRVLGLVRGKPGLKNSLEFVLVDEGQDLSPEVYEIIDEAARHVTVFADPLQKIFDDGADTGLIFDRLHVTNPSVTVLGAFRNAKYVAELASHFIEEENKRKHFLAQISTIQTVKERPLCFVAGTADQEMDRLAEIVRARQMKNERIGILVPNNRLLHGLARGLEDRGISLEKAATKQNGGKRAQVTCNFANLVPKIATVFQAKGLTFDSVLLPRLTSRAFEQINKDRMLRMTFVGIARATQWTYLSTISGQEFDGMSTLDDAFVQGHLVKQGSRDWRSGGGTMGRKGGYGHDGGQDADDDFSVL